MNYLLLLCVSYDDHEILILVLYYSRLRILDKLKAKISRLW